jgi:16S rRNA G1207 methylase RsmC
MNSCMRVHQVQIDQIVLKNILCLWCDKFCKCLEDYSLLKPSQVFGKKTLDKASWMLAKKMSFKQKLQ